MSALTKAFIVLHVVLTMLFVSALTIMLGGVTAALFERASGRQETDNASLAIWAAAVAVIAWPGLEAFLRL